MTDLAAMKRDLLAECADDHVGLWVVVGYVEDEMQTANDDEIRNSTLEVLYELLKSGKIEAGYPDSNGVDFHPWPFPADVLIDHIRSAWKSLGRRPNPGEIAWFTTPSRSSAASQQP